MTKEEKARAYDEAMNKIKPLYEQAKKDGNPIWSTYEYLIPELAESEDEKFRRYILNCCEVTIEEGDRGLELSMSTTKKLKAWLEKQKEHNYSSDETERFDLPEDWIEKRKLECPFKRQLDKNFYGCNRYEGVVGICDGHCSWVVDYPKLKEFKDRIKNKMEQEDGVLTQIKNMELISSDITLEKIEKATDELVQEWSEEDERMSSRCIKSIETSKSFADSETFKSAKDKEISWLNNLVEDCKRRKADIAKLCSNEWSEEDERMLNGIIAHAKATNTLFSDQINFLKSLRPSWKPSEEQMGVLMETIDSTPDTYEPRCTLVSLYNDLKELKK